VRLADEIATSLGLATASVPWQTQRAPVTRLGDALTTLSDAFGTIASDVLVLARPEIAELSEPGGTGRGGSSSMPQKRNPILSVLTVSAARKAPALAAELHRSAGAAVDERPDGAWHGEWQTLRELMRLVGGAAALVAELTTGLVVHPGAMMHNLKLSGPLVVAERIMLEFAPLVGAARIQEIIAARADDDAFDIVAALRAEPTLAEVSAAHLAEVVYPVAYLGDADLLIDRALAAAAGEVQP